MWVSLMVNLVSYSFFLSKCNECDDDICFIGIMGALFSITKGKPVSTQNINISPLIFPASG